MLVIALALALIGFFLLVVALWLGQVLWAWVCVAAGVLGLVLLVVDALRRK